MPEPVPLDLDEYLTPIEGGHPAGPDLRWEDEYAGIESAREEVEAITEGVYRRDGKRADWESVIRIGLGALKSKSKDIQVAAWVAEALGRRRGLAGLRDGLRLVRAVQDVFWEAAHPGSGDLELREGAYEFLNDDKQLPLLIRSQPLTRSSLLPSYSYLKFRESREVENEIRKKPDNEAELAEGKLRAEDFDKAADATDRAFLEATVARLLECQEAVSELNDSIRAEGHYGRKGRTLSKTSAALEEVARLAGQLLAKKSPPVEVEVEEPPDEPEPEEIEEHEDEEAVDEPEPARKAPTRAPRSSSGPIADAEDARGRIVAASAYLRRDDPSDPAGYLVARALRMGELFRLPEPLDPSRLPPPASEDRQTLRRLDGEGAWEELLDRAELVLSRPEGTGWLDARRFALKALGELGHDEAARGARALLAAELREYPGWPTSELDDGTPCGNAETRAWIAEVFASPAGPPPELVYSPAEAEPSEPRPEDAPADPWDVARELLAEGKAPEAIAAIGRAARESRTGRERFLRTFQQAELCLMMGRPGVALPLLDGLARQIDEFRLDRWEDPSLCARVIAALYRCLKGKDEERARLVYQRLCQLDIGQALGLGDSGDP